MHPRWPWQPDPRRGTARGMAVLGPAGFDEPDNVRELLHHHEALDGWLATQGALPEHDRAGLAGVDELLADWSADPRIGPRLGNEVGAFLGCVLVTAVPGAEWSVWPNGHPVVSVGGREFDVLEVVRRRLETGAPLLPEVLDEAAGAA